MTLNEQTNYILLDKELLESCFRTLGNLLKKRIKIKGAVCELIVVGGASVVLNYNFRLTTMDIDCTDESRILMNDLTNEVAEKYQLPYSWINTDFTKTKSYSPKINRYSVYYKSYGNGSLIVRTIKDEYLLAMKIVSGRKYKNDFSDIYGILKTCTENNHTISMEQIETAIIDLYGSMDCANPDALTFVKKIINDPGTLHYQEIRRLESQNASIIKSKIAQSDEQSDIDYILSKLTGLE